jgi:signal transduction histidine kinase
MQSVSTTEVPDTLDDIRSTFERIDKKHQRAMARSVFIVAAVAVACLAVVVGIRIAG